MILYLIEPLREFNSKVDNDAQYRQCQPPKTNKCFKNLLSLLFFYCKCVCTYCEPNKRNKYPITNHNHTNESMYFFVRGLKEGKQSCANIHDREIKAISSQIMCVWFYVFIGLDHLINSKEIYLHGLLMIIAHPKPP